MLLLPDDVAGLARELGLLFVLALVLSAGGLFRVVYFISVGYAFSISAMALVSAIRFSEALDVATAAQCGLLLAYGLRLGGFLLARERSASYRKELVEIEQRSGHLGMGVRFAIWGSVALLYAVMFSPALFVLLARRAQPELSAAPVQWLGLGVMLLGLGLEAWADRQKSAFKAQQPDRFCDVKLYAWVRCPNYLGEMFFWLGAWVAGAQAYATAFHWVASLSGFVCIQLVMLGSARRLELKQEERYGSNPEYQAYAARVPVLLPWVPLYSLKRLKLYLG